MSFEIKGWCPGAHRPMMSGDGYVVRVRPRLAHLGREQALGLCEAALRFGAGTLDLTNRANVQVRGVAEDAWPGLMDELGALGLLDADVETESRRNIVTAPTWVEKDDTEWLALELIARLHELADLPPKMGFAIDAGTNPVLQSTPSDFRIERGVSGGLILRADGRPLGMPLPEVQEIDALIRLTWWFMASGGAEARRMACHTAPLPDWANGTEAPAPAGAPLMPGPHAMGMVYGGAFGQVQARDLLTALDQSCATGVRVTPWRTLLLLGAEATGDIGDLLASNQPELHANACYGRPYCPQAQGETLSLARRIARETNWSPTQSLHVSGCAKGCAHPFVADITITARDSLYDIATAAKAGDAPDETGLTADQVLAHFGAR